ncbi:hypothetical protein N7509_002710 [Penicillium cosmopolitanum]|uniref:RRM domain-containing protein n=1 Tax=Penicillium cosmopolitanum TaxID=1131564 RepID=A0A9W9W9A5_9EURO|nr:uncharacterized protein N7509_002710 [Penicillium cosmopolitanum]KAJ5408827.1 hypothetical protein N7509_002710 [Penicillium cosmopolitanum]
MANKIPYLITQGNLPYNAKPYDIETLLGDNGFNHLENIHISIDPVSARTPGYCFVDFLDRQTADRALSDLKASINGRPVKVGPCQPKKQNRSRWASEDDHVNKRWGDWNSQNGNPRNMDRALNGQGPH